MKTFSINSLGCKVNQYESQQIRELLENFGLHKVEPSKKPDLVVINSCCVTHTASAKSRQCIRKIRKQSPNAVIIVSGCLPTVQIGELSAVAEDAHLIRNRSDLAHTLSCIIYNKAATLTSQRTQSCPDTTIKAQNSYKIKYKNELNNHMNLPPLTSFDGQTRAFLKIQDGCDGYCTYCIVPKTRPFVRSKPVDEVLNEAQALVEAGHREIVVTGIFLGAYGRQSVRRKNWPDQQNNHLADLLDKMAEIPNLARIRLSSLEPADLTPRLLDTFCRHCNIMPHLHLSLQSGSDNILRKMCRQYRVEEFREKVETAKSRLDRPAITTDIIVGFPGETDADFEQTVNMAKIIGIAKMHVFSFSPRKGTAAADMQESIDNKVIKERSKILRDLDIELGLKYRRQFIGETAKILIEKDNGQLCGRSERYFTVYLKNKENNQKRNSVVKVKLIENRENGMAGAIAR
ncbi:MAG: tRNA (N(6)-L-threonylcarbamoyladenosine(37)-C(2))-methylthiotransferase MtaB [Planctomycetes bacterium RBG_19FT_COMBO_48_8]|nr:MAG: tRNA (N(6)-L-threonylcarbamoyladenosine(37)-C(2))-methylthiotransferase MtaB [Planctomycetes bacterium RBG_19FT_COMBO_48_8]